MDGTRPARRDSPTPLSTTTLSQRQPPDARRCWWRGRTRTSATGAGGARSTRPELDTARESPPEKHPADGPSPHGRIAAQAAYEGREDAVIALAKGKASLMSRTDSGLTAIMIAKDHLPDPDPD